MLYIIIINIYVKYEQNILKKFSKFLKYANSVAAISSVYSNYLKKVTYIKSLDILLMIITKSDKIK